MNNFNIIFEGVSHNIEANSLEEAHEILESLTSVEAKLENTKLLKVALLKSDTSKKLAETDWKELRHYRQKYLAVTTSLTEEEFVDLLEEREAIRESSNTLETQINACTTIEQIEAIEWN